MLEKKEGRGGWDHTIRIGLVFKAHRLLDHSTLGARTCWDFAEEERGTLGGEDHIGHGLVNLQQHAELLEVDLRIITSIINNLNFDNLVSMYDFLLYNPIEDQYGSSHCGDL